jgi:hypothetical protein
MEAQSQNVIQHQNENENKKYISAFIQNVSSIKKISDMCNCKSNGKPIQVKYRKFKEKNSYGTKDSAILIPQALFGVRKDVTEHDEVTCLFLLMLYIATLFKNLDYTV